MDRPVPRALLDVEQLVAFLGREFPQIGLGRNFTVEAVGPMTARLRLHQRPEHLRPGGTISGPTMFALADVALYAAILAQVGEVKLAVTTSLTINFLQRPPPGDLIGEARLFKLGKRLAVGEVAIHSAAAGAMVAHATGSYSLPPRGSPDEVS